MVGGRSDRGGAIYVPSLTHAAVCMNIIKSPPKKEREAGNFFPVGAQCTWKLTRTVPPTAGDQKKDQRRERWGA